MTNVLTTTATIDDSLATLVAQTVVETIREENLFLNLSRVTLCQPGMELSEILPVMSNTIISASAISNGATEGDAIDSQALSTTGATITPAMNAAVVTLTKMSKYARVDWAKMAGSQIGLALAAKIDTALAALMAGFSNTTGTTAVEMTWDDVWAAATKLNTTAQMHAVRAVLALHPFGYGQLVRSASAGVGVNAQFLGIPGVLDNTFSGGRGLLGSNKGYIAGNIPVFVSNNVPTMNTAADRGNGLFVRPSSMEAADGAIWCRMGLPSFETASGLATRSLSDVYAGWQPAGVSEIDDLKGITLLCKNSN